MRSQQASSPAASAGSPPQRAPATPAAASSPQVAPPSPARVGPPKGRGAVAQKKGPVAKRKPSTNRASAAAPLPAQAPVEIVDDTPQVTDTPSPGSSGKRQRQEEPAPPENNVEEADERSPKRSKVGEAEIAPEAAPDDLALAAAVAAAMQSPENAMTFHEAALANFNGYNLGSLAAPGTEEITVGDVGGAGAPSLNELLQQAETQLISTSDGLISSATPGPSTAPWLQRESDPMWLSSVTLRSTSSTNASTLYDGGAFELSDFLDVSTLAYEDGDEGLRITATPELANSSQGPTPNSILESPAGAGLSRPLESSPKGLRETATDRPLATFASGGSDFLKDIGIPEGPHYHRGTEWSFDGEMAASEWSISYEDRIVSSTA